MATINSTYSEQRFLQELKVIGNFTAPVGRIRPMEIFAKGLALVRLLQGICDASNGYRDRMFKLAPTSIRTCLSLMLFMVRETTRAKTLALVMLSGQSAESKVVGVSSYLRDLV